MRGLRPTLVVGAVFALAACSDEAANPVTPPSADGVPILLSRAINQGIPDEYIVVLKEGVDPRSVAAVAAANPRYVYEAAINGFAATLNAGQLNALRNNPNVEYIEQDQVMSVDATQSNATWGLDRINQRDLPLDGSYTYTYTGSGVRAYIIDTGLQANHPQFGTRAQNVYNAISGESAADCNGHGTHVGGTVGGSTYGVAKAVLLRGVKVLSCSGSGSTSGVIAGIDWVRTNHVKPAIANMSLGGAKSDAQNTAVTNLSNAGVFVAVAAGNENADACTKSPASTPVAYTTAASDKTDTRATFSNYGSCVDAYAPGVGITSAWINSSTNTISGTSMASPHVAGVSALIKHRYGDISSSSVTSYLNNALTASKIKNNPSGTKNALLYKYVTSW
jgi:subtilisin family serine protease